MDQLKELVEQCEFTTQKGKVTSAEALKMAHFLLAQVKKQQGMIYVIGNGGSAGIASHFCTDLLKTLNLSAATLTDPCVATCFANDFGYEYVFSAPLERNLKDQDLLVAISSSGKSPNILNAVECAKQKKIPVLTLSGFLSSNPLRSAGDLNFWIESLDYGLVESGHFFLLHTIIDTWDAYMTHAKFQCEEAYAR